MVIMVAIPIHPRAIDGLAVLLVAPLTECLSIDEMAVVGFFLNVLGDLLALNSAYLSYVQDEEAPTNKQANQTDQNDYEVIQKSIEKIQEELKKIQQEKKN